MAAGHSQSAPLWMCALGIGILVFVKQQASPLKRVNLISADKGGANLTWFVEGTPETMWRSGVHYNQRKFTTTVNPHVRDDALVAGLWDRSAALVGIA